MKRKRFFYAVLVLAFLLAQPIGASAPEQNEETVPPAIEQTEPPANESTDGTVDNSEDVPLDETADNSADTSTDAPLDESTDSSADASIDAPLDESADNSADESTDAPLDESADNSADESTDAPFDESADNSADESTDTPLDESIDVYVPSNGQVLFNPYGCVLTLDGEVTVRQIVSTQEMIVNNGKTPVVVSASTAITAPDDAGIEFVDEPFAPEMYGKTIFMYAEFQTVSEDSPTAWKEEYHAHANQLPADTTGENLFVLQPGECAAYRVFGTMGTDLAEGEFWSNLDQINFSVNFTFAPLVQENLPDSPVEETPSDSAEPPVEETPSDSVEPPVEEVPSDSVEPPVEEVPSDSVEPPVEEAPSEPEESSDSSSQPDNVVI